VPNLNIEKGHVCSNLRLPNTPSFVDGCLRSFDIFAGDFDSFFRIIRSGERSSAGASPLFLSDPQGLVRLAKRLEQSKQANTTQDERPYSDISRPLGPLCGLRCRIGRSPLGAQVGFMIFWAALAWAFLWRACGVLFLPFQSRRNIRKSVAYAGVGFGIFFSGFWLISG
jgi:hypothetical protein